MDLLFGFDCVGLLGFGLVRNLGNRFSWFRVGFDYVNLLVFGCVDLSVFGLVFG